MKKYGIITIIALGAFLAGKYLFPPKPEVKEVVKYVEVEKKVQNKDKVVKSTKIKKPDGTVVTETTVVENTKTTTDKSSKLESEKLVRSAAKITVGVLAIKDASDFSAPTAFGATISVPVFGNVKAQALGTTDKRIGLGLALEF